MKAQVLQQKSYFFLCCVSLLLILLLAESAYPQSPYPSRPITLILPMPAGFGVDLAYRVIAKEAEKFLGQPIIVINKPGGGTTIGIAALAASKPDGYTIGYTPTSGMVVAPFLEKLPYHPLNDFQQIMQYAESNFGVTVKADSPFKSFKDIIAYARQNPKKLIYATKGDQDIANITMVQIAKKEGVQMKLMPFRGDAEIMAALLGGHIDIGAGSFSYPLLEAGQIRLIALLSENRSPDYSQTPILKDLGYDILPVCAWLSVAVPKAIPEEVVKKLEEAFTKAMNEPVVIKGLKELRFPNVYRNSREMSDLIVTYYKAYEILLKEMGLTK